LPSSLLRSSVASHVEARPVWPLTATS
jgi:hypothetical protein